MESKMLSGGRTIGSTSTTSPESSGALSRLIAGLSTFGLPGPLFGGVFEFGLSVIDGHLLNAIISGRFLGSLRS
jgi:hypothetical protein